MIESKDAGIEQRVREWLVEQLSLWQEAELEIGG